MKILYLHQYFNTPAMAGGTRSFEMARRLVAAGHEVELITTWREPSEHLSWYVTDEAGIKVHWLPVSYSNKMSFLQRVFAFFRFALASAMRAASIRADVVFATSTPLTIALPGLFASWRLRVPFVFEVRDMWPAVPIAMGVLKNPLLIRVAFWLERLAYVRAKHVVALAPGMGDDIVASGIDPSKISVIPNGCDLDVFANIATEGNPLRCAHPWLGSRKLILFAGTVGRANGVDYLVHVAASARQLDPEVRFVVIGDGAELERVQELAARYEVLERNLFFIPAMPKRKLACWLAEADMTIALFVGPRVLWKDAVQNKFFDSLAAGKPVACNFLGFQSEIAVEHDVGLIIDGADAGHAAAQLLDKLRDVEWMNGVSARAGFLAKGRFNRDQLAGDLAKVLTDAVRDSDQFAQPRLF